MWRFMYYHSSEHQGKSGVGGAGVGSAGSEGKHKTHTFSKHRGCTNPSGSGGVGMLKEWGTYFIGKWVSAIENFDRQQSLPV